jgi:hypothetical protein
VPDAGVEAGGPAGVDDGGPAGVDDGGPEGLPVEPEVPGVAGVPEVPAVEELPPPAGVTPVQLIVERTEFAFGCPSDAIFARHSPGRALELGPLPCLLEVTVFGLVEVSDEPPDEDPERDGSPVAPVDLLPLWSPDLPRLSACVLLLPGTETPIFASTSDAVPCAAPGSDPVAAAADPAPKSTTDAAAAVFAARVFEIILLLPFRFGMSPDADSEGE